MPEQQTQKVNTHLSKIAHINLLLAVCALVGVGIVYAWLRWGARTPEITQTQNTNSVTNTQSQSTNTNAQPTAEEIAALTQDYQNSVNDIFGDLDLTDTSAVADASTQVMALHVPADLRPFQVQLLVVLQDAQNGQSADADQRIAQLHAQYSWFAR